MDDNDIPIECGLFQQANVPCHSETNQEWFEEHSKEFMVWDVLDIHIQCMDLKALLLMSWFQMLHHTVSSKVLGTVCIFRSELLWDALFGQYLAAGFIVMGDWYS